jgi:hypothetical protein
MRRVLSLLAVFASFHAAAADKADRVDRLVVVGVAEPFGGPGPTLTQLTRELRNACAERTQGVLDAAEVHDRMLGPTTKATLPQLDRAYSAAVNMVRNGEEEVALRTLTGIADDLERLPETTEGFNLWVRTMLRLAFLEDARAHKKEAKLLLESVLAVQPTADDEKAGYPAPFVQSLERARTEVNGKRHVQLTVQSSRKAIVAVNGRPFGESPITIPLPPGRYRITGIAGKLRAPIVAVELANEPETVNLDFGLADAFRPDGGPGLALGRSDRALGIIRAGGWLGADKILAATSVREGGGDFLVATIYDVHRGAVTREGRVRVGAGGVLPGSMAMLVKFLFTGERGEGVLASDAPPPKVELRGKGTLIMPKTGEK